ncbi:hypothetical protein HPB47_018729 [Ixodes persulcatus]|uniref:Uncharacterized protein n=1 Tax=Ixodes persulcatus TaxID=34615 RepID=A0AC60R1E9_IXOPE|nr:hypothetical protein HPB47_018729 [Ixodes persulcatus]
MSLGGKGRLTADLITRLSSYYGWALKSHKGDVDAMHKAVVATYHYITFNDQNAAKTKQEPVPKHHYNLPDHVCTALLLVYTHLADKMLLQRRQRGKTQNANESLHLAAVAEAILRSKVGSQWASRAFLKELNVKPGTKGMKRGAENDFRQSATLQTKHASKNDVQRAMKRRHAGQMHADYVP